MVEIFFHRFIGRISIGGMEYFPNWYACTPECGTTIHYFFTETEATDWASKQDKTCGFER
jgi:hypothetical protein